MKKRLIPAETRLADDRDRLVRTLGRILARTWCQSETEKNQKKLAKETLCKAAWVPDLNGLASPAPPGEPP